MSKYCAVAGCNNNTYHYTKKRFYRLPHVRKQHETLTRLRRSRWLTVLKKRPKESENQSIYICEDHFISGKVAHWTDINNPDWVPTKNIDYKLVQSNAVKQEQACNKITDKESEAVSQKTPVPISEEASTSSNCSRTEETSQDDELQNSLLPSSSISEPAAEVPNKRPRIFLLCKRTSPLKTSTTRSSTKAPEVLIDENKNRVENERVKSVYEEIEHNLRVERLHKQIELVQKKIDVQNKLLEMLDKNPEKLNLKF